MKCSVFIAVSVDGFIARKDGSVDFLDAVQAKDEDYGYQAFADSIDCVVFGRTTWELASSFPQWPYEGKRVVVLTHRALDAKRGEESHGGDVAALAVRLARDGVKRVYVDGGHVIRQFLEAGLVDDITLSVIPIVLGGGISLFGEGAEKKLTLESSESYASGLVQLRYRVG